MLFATVLDVAVEVYNRHLLPDDYLFDINVELAGFLHRCSVLPEQWRATRTGTAVWTRRTRWPVSTTRCLLSSHHEQSSGAQQYLDALVKRNLVNGSVLTLLHPHSGLPGGVPNLQFGSIQPTEVFGAGQQANAAQVQYMVRLCADF